MDHELLNTLQGESDDARFMAFMTLYLSKDGGVVFEELLASQDPILKILTIRFLSGVPEERSIRYLLRVIQDDNQVVRESATRAFEKNRCDGKVRFLIPLISSSCRSAQIFAIDHLCQAGIMEAVEPLMQLLPGSDDALLIVALTGLRFLPNRRLIDVMVPYYSDERLEIRVRAFLVASSLFENNFQVVRRVLIHGLDDPSPRVRQAAVWGLDRIPQRQNLPYFFRLSASDPDPKVREAALLALGHFSTARVIHHLVKRLVTEKDKMVALKCESVLLSMDPKHLVGGLNKVMFGTDVVARNKALLLAAEFQRIHGMQVSGKSRFYRYLVTGLQKATRDEDRVPYIEAMGVFEDSAAVSILTPFLYQSPLLAYVAMVSILKIIKMDDYLASLLTDPKLSSLLKQMVLKQIVKRGTRSDVARLGHVLLGFLKDDNVNMRYLAAQALVRLPGEEVVPDLMEALFIETDPTSIRLLEGSLVDHLSTNPFLILTLLNDCKKPDLLSEILQRLIMEKAVFLKFIPLLFSHPAIAAEGKIREAALKMTASYIIRGIVTLDEVVLALKPTPQALVELAPLLANQPNVHLTAHAMANQPALVALAGVAGDLDVVPFLVQMACTSADETIAVREALIQIGERYD